MVCRENFTSGAYLLCDCRRRLRLDDSLSPDLAADMKYLATWRKQQDGKTLVSPIGMRRGWWSQTAASEFPIIGRAAVRLLSAHATTGASERNWSAWGNFYSADRNPTKVETAEKVIYVKANHQGGAAPSKDFKVQMDALDWSSEEEASGDDDDQVEDTE